MNCLRHQKNKKIEDTITKDVRNLVRLKKEIDSNAINGKTNLFKLAIKDRVIRDIRNLFEHEEEDYYKLVRLDNFGGNFFSY